jgi:hypothetical protein
MPVAEQGQPEGPFRRGGRWLHHHPVWWFVVTVILDSGYGLLREHSEVARMTLGSLVIALFFAAIFATAVHRTDVCWRCIDEVPLDGTQEAQEHHRALTWTHRIYDRTLYLWGVRITVWPTAFWVGWVVLTLSVPTQNFIVYEVVELGFWAWILITWTIEHQHNRLYPWCPQCHDDGWDGREESPKVPDPAPAGEKQNV